MTRIHKSHSRFFSFLGMITIAAFGIVSTLGSGGGDGGDAGVEQPTTFMYTLSGPNAGDPISASTSLDGDTINVTATPTLEGIYDSSSNVYTLSATCQGGDCNITAIVDGAPILHNAVFNMLITITSRWSWIDANYPTQGQFRIDCDAYINCEVTGTINPSATVDISLTDGTDTFELTWDQFVDRWQDPEHPTDNPFWLRMASFAFSLNGLLFEQVWFLGESYLFIEEHRSALELNNFYSEFCSQPLPPDLPGSAWTNTVSATWNDTGNDGVIDTDEIVSFLMVECWVDDPSNPIDTLISGEMVLYDLTPYSVSCPEYNMFTVEETENSDTIPDSGYQLNGGFCFTIIEM